MQDDDLTRLSAEELNARIEAAEAALIAHKGRTVEAAVAALGPSTRQLPEQHLIGSLPLDSTRKWGFVLNLWPTRGLRC
jgi:hypothetical protein